MDDGPPEEARALARSIRARAGASAGYGGTGYGDSEPARQLRVLVDDYLGRGLPTDRLTALIAGFCAATAEESVAAGNTVLARARATGDRAGAVEAAVARHNTLVATLAAGRHRPLAALLGELVDGNRSAHRALTGVRYPGLPLDVFDHLHTVGGAGRR